MKTFFISLLVAWIILAPFVFSQRVRNALFHPSYGACGRCLRTWDVVNGHTTFYGDSIWTVTGQDGKKHEERARMGAGCFPLCEGCWLELDTPEARLPYYREWVDSTGKPDLWPAVQKAVMEEVKS